MEKGFETLEQIRETLITEGRNVTRAQLERWRKWGLVRTPSVRGLGRGRGTEARYPIGTTALIRDLMTALDERRSGRRAGWSLWLQGHDVSRFFLNELKLWEKALSRMYRDFDKALSTGHSSVSGRTTRFLRSVTGNRSVQWWEKLIAEVASGRFDGTWITVTEDQKLLRKLHRSADARERFETEMSAKSPDVEQLFPVSDFRAISEHFTAPALRRAIKAASPERLVQTQTEFVALRAAIHRSSRFLIPIEQVEFVAPLWFAARWGGGFRPVLEGFFADPKWSENVPPWLSSLFEDVWLLVSAPNPRLSLLSATASQSPSNADTSS